MGDGTVLPGPLVESFLDYGRHAVEVHVFVAAAVLSLILLISSSWDSFKNAVVSYAAVCLRQ